MVLSHHAVNTHAQTNGAFSAAALARVAGRPWLLRGRRAGLRVRIARGWRAAKKGGSSSSRAVKLLSRLLAAELLCWEGVGLPCS